MSLDSTYEFLKILSIIWISITLLLTFTFAIIEIALSNIDSIKHIKPRRELINRFNIALEKVSYQKTDEILECMLEIESLDKIYNEIVENNYGFIDSLGYERIKEDKISRIINEKIEKIKIEKNKKEKLKSLYDELKVCENRFPQYKIILNKFINEVSIL